MKTNQVYSNQNDLNESVQTKNNFVCLKSIDDKEIPIKTNIEKIEKERFQELNKVNNMNKKYYFSSNSCFYSCSNNIEKINKD